MPRMAFRCTRTSTKDSLWDQIEKVDEDTSDSNLSNMQEERTVDKACEKTLRVEKKTEVMQKTQCVPIPPSTPRRQPLLGFRNRAMLRDGKIMSDCGFEPKDGKGESEREERPSRVRMRFLLAQREAARLQQMD